MEGLLVQGKKASLNEYNVAAALTQLNLNFDFQVNVDGGRTIRGGLVLDFLVYTVPKPTPLQVHGNYFHKGEAEAEDRLKELKLLEKPYWYPPVTVWGNESETVEDALLALRRELMV